MKRPHGFDGGGEAHEPPELTDLSEGDTRLDDDAVEASVIDRGESRVPLDSSANDTAETTELMPLSTPARSRLVKQWRRATEDPVARAKRELKAAQRARRSHDRRERRRFSADSRRRRRALLIVLGAVAGLVLFVLAGVVTPLTAVRDVQVTGASLVNADEVKAALEKFTETPLALVDDAEVHDALEPFPLIQRYAIERIPPHTLKVRIEERMPVVSIEADGEYHLYDPAGVLIGTSEEPPEGVPRGEERVSEVSSESFTAAATVLRDMPSDLRAQVSVARATSGQDLSFTLSSGERVIWGDAEQTQRKAVVLSAMLRALENEAVESIDVSSTEAPVFQ